MLVSIGAYDICDGTLEGGVAITRLQISQRRITDVVPFILLDPSQMPPTNILISNQSTYDTYALASPVTYNRLARPCTYAFVVNRVHASSDAAEQFILELEANLPSTGAVSITTTGPSPVSFVIPNAKVQSHELIQQLGASTFHSYSIIGGPPPTS